MSELWLDGVPYTMALAEDNKGRRVLTRETRAAVDSDAPVTKQIYAGTSGSTHGERKLAMPPPAAATYDIPSPTIPLSALIGPRPCVDDQVQDAAHFGNEVSERGRSPHRASLQVPI